MLLRWKGTSAWVLHGDRVSGGAAWREGLVSGWWGCLATALVTLRIGGEACPLGTYPQQETPPFPQPAGVIDTSGYRRELRLPEALCGRCRFHCPNRSPHVTSDLGSQLLRPLKVVAPANGSPGKVAVRRCGTSPAATFENGPSSGGDSWPAKSTPQQRTLAVGRNSTGVDTPCANATKRFFQAEEFAIGPTDCSCPYATPQTPSFPGLSSQFLVCRMAKIRSLMSNSKDAPVCPKPARQESSRLYCRETFVLRRKGWPEGHFGVQSQVDIFRHVEFIAPATGVVPSERSRKCRPSRPQWRCKTFIRRRAQLTADSSLPQQSDAVVGPQCARVLESCAHLGVTGRRCTP